MSDGPDGWYNPESGRWDATTPMNQSTKSTNQVGEQPMRYAATVNIPGHLPTETDPVIFDTVRDAWTYLEEEYKKAVDEVDTTSDTELDLNLTSFTVYSDNEVAGTVYTNTPGYEGHFDLGIAYTVSVVEEEDTDEKADAEQA
jgi:hypothetical protein